MKNRWHQSDNSKLWVHGPCRDQCVEVSTMTMRVDALNHVWTLVQDLGTLGRHEAVSGFRIDVTVNSTMGIVSVTLSC